MNYIQENINKFEKLYEIVLKDSNSELLTPYYFKKLNALVYLSGFIHNYFKLDDSCIYNEELLNYKKEIDKFHYDSIEIYNTLSYNNEIEEIILNL
jgi:hypothetical protein